MTHSYAYIWDKLTILQINGMYPPCNAILTAHDGTAYSQNPCDRVDHATALEDLHILSMMTV